MITPHASLAALPIPRGPRVSTPASVWIEADGGSRGNPGPSAYGAVLKDAATGETIAERGETIGVATNNVAEYRGLIAGLELYREHTPGAALEVRMDSRLVVEQMSGTWKIKHPDMKPLALEARRLAPAGTTFTWVPRERNAHADRLANEALDGLRDAGGPVATGSTTRGRDGRRPPEQETPPLSDAEYRGWSGGGTAPTTFLLVRHGVTDHTNDKRFSGGLASSNPGLNDEGRAQVRATAEWLAPVAEGLDAIVTSPVRRTRESAEILGEVLGFEVGVEEGLAEMEFGAWDGLTYTEVRDKFPDEVRDLARKPRPRAGRRRVVPRGREAGAGRPRPAARGARRQDRAPGQPRDPDQDPRRRRPGRAAGVAVPDGALPGLGDRGQLLPGDAGGPARDGVAAAVQRATDRRAVPGGLVPRPRSPRRRGQCPWRSADPPRPSSRASRGGRRGPPGCAAPYRPRAARAPAGPWSPC